jgi:DNA-binding NarL/FixJ family response regulator
MDDIRVLIVADDPLARAGLAALLNGQPGCIVVGQVAGDEKLPETLDVYRPDVLVWDLGWDSSSEPETLNDLADGGPPIIALLPEESQAAAIWTAGARGLLLRDTSADRLLAALQAVIEGLAVFDPALVSALPFAHPLPPTEELTTREREVLHLLAEGLPNKAIARQLDISEHTVKFHINAILGKLHAQSRTEAVVQAIRLGLITL